MARVLTVGAAQLGPIARNEPRGAVVERLLTLMRKAHARGCGLVVYPELALTTFFPRWYMPDQDEVDGFFETEMPNEETAPLFAEARKLGVGFHLGYAELVEGEGRRRHFNTAILVDQTGQIVVQVPQGAPARAQRARARSAVPAPREALLRAG